MSVIRKEDQLKAFEVEGKSFLIIGNITQELKATCDYVKPTKLPGKLIPLIEGFGEIILDVKFSFGPSRRLLNVVVHMTTCLLIIRPHFKSIDFR